jgi:hypothetical protein
VVGRAALAVSLGFLAAGCGGSKTPSVASLDTTTSSSTSDTTPSQKPSAVAFATCMTAHGVLTQTPGGRGIIMSDATPAQANAALAACRSLMPGGGPPPMTPAQQAKRTQQLYVFSTCMRSHGVASFPDPDSAGELPLDKIGSLDTQTPRFSAAYAACRSVFPRTGPQIRFGRPQ